MSEHRYTIDDIQKRTGLPKNYLERCSTLFADLFLDLGYRTHGANNITLYDDNGLFLFDRIKELKESGYNRPQIRKKLAEELRSRRQTPGATLPNQPQNSGESVADGTIKLVIEALQKEHQNVLQAKDQVIAELKEKQLLLTDGRSPEEVRAEWNRKREHEQKRAKLISELETLQRRWFFNKTRRQKKIVKQLRELNS